LPRHPKACGAVADTLITGTPDGLRGNIAEHVFPNLHIGSTGGTFQGDTRMKLLVIDDEEMIRSLAEKILNRAGFEVLLAESGEEGLQHFTREPDQIGLILLDMFLDGQSGVDTLRQIRQIAPTVPCIISSGHAEDHSEIPEDLAQSVDFLHKPYRAGQLVDKVNLMLSMKRPDSALIRPTNPLYSLQCIDTALSVGETYLCFGNYPACSR